jgi:glycosyltransferase involved in cell wall biosynthesis
MPAYNAGQWIGEAIESCQAQTMRDWKLRVFDDGSNDDTQDVVAVRARDDSRIHLRLSQHHGQAVALNGALGMACGEFIAHLNADDLMRPEKLARQVAYLREHPDIDIVSTGMVLFGDREGVRLGNGMQWRAFINADPRSGVCCASLMCRAETFRKVGPFDETLRTSGDDDWNLRALALGMRWGHIPEPLYLYRQHSDSLSHRRRDEGYLNYCRSIAKYRDAIEARWGP